MGRDRRPREDRARHQVARRRRGRAARRRRPPEDADALIAPAGDRALVVTLGERIDEATFQRVQAALEVVTSADAAITDVVAGFASITVHYDPARIVLGDEASPYAVLRRRVDTALARAEQAPQRDPRTVEIPACYEGELAPDLDEVARRCALSREDVVALHTAPTYTVHVIGFLPGFPYLGGLDPRLAVPRRDEPRTRVPAGSVGIGGAQTGVYPIASPGGWQLIGRTTLALFDAHREPPTLLRVGDRVRFRAIGRDAYDAAFRP